jgi:hypothetical protein
MGVDHGGTVDGGEHHQDAEHQAIAARDSKLGYEGAFSVRV